MITCNEEGYNCSRWSSGDAPTRITVGPPAPRSRLQGPATTEQKRLFDVANEEVIKRLGKEDCAKLFGADGLEQYQSATIRVGFAFIDDTTRYDFNKVAFTPTVDKKPTGEIVLNLFNSTTTGFFTAETTAYRAAVLLHELGHLTGVLGDDRFDKSVGDIFDESILKDCFGIKPKQRNVHDRVVPRATEPHTVRW